jgi:hygromycin-B 4-O-kinase
MGRYAAMINSIQTQGFGSTFEWCRNELSQNASWAEFLRNELKLEENLSFLAEHGMLNVPRMKKVRTTLERAARKNRVPYLNHGDLRLKNVLVDEKGAISCILDWEHCVSNLAPEWELAIALHDLSIDEKEEFLKGYGLSGNEISAISPVLKALNLIDYGASIRAAAKLKGTTQLEWYRARLQGQMDLYF